MILWRWDREERDTSVGLCSRAEDLDNGIGFGSEEHEWIFESHLLAFPARGSREFRGYPVYYTYRTPETAVTAPLLLILFCLESCFYVCG